LTHRPDSIVGRVTFSICARSVDGESLGVAVASKFLAVGAYVPVAEAGTGAIATQSFANLAFRKSGLALLRQGHRAQETLDMLVGPDDRRSERQVGIVDARGGSATFTGQDCNNWAGGVTGDGYAIQGNILSGEQVVRSMENAWLATASEPDLTRRLLTALRAGDEAGGDRRGRQSASLLVVSPGAGYGGGNDVLCDLRVDDHIEPVTELAKLLDLHDLYFGSPRDEDLLPLEGAILDEVARLLVLVGFASDKNSPEDVHSALFKWAGVENLEERVPDANVIDSVVLGVLKQRAAN
jgi:uncharacterized Ntn-hydrolase superfamily protein